MAGGRAAARAAALAGSTWKAQRQQAELLQAALDAAPHAQSLPGHLCLALDAALRCLGHQGGRHATSVAVAVEAAALHLERALAAAPAPHAHLAHSFAHAALLLSTPQARRAAAAGAVEDDLALPATWELDAGAYALVVLRMGWEPLLLDSLLLLWSGGGGGGSGGGAAARLAGGEKAEAGGPAAVRMLDALLRAAGPAGGRLAEGLLALLWPPLAVAAASEESEAAAVAIGVVRGPAVGAPWHVTRALLAAALDGAADGDEADAHAPQLCASLAACLSHALRSLLLPTRSDGAPAAVVAEVARQAALLLEHHLASLPLSSSSATTTTAATPPADEGEGGHARLQQLAASLRALEPQLSEASKARPTAAAALLPAGELLRLKCRLLLLLPSLPPPPTTATTATSSSDDCSGSGSSSLTLPFFGASAAAAAAVEAVEASDSSAFAALRAHGCMGGLLRSLRQPEGGGGDLPPPGTSWLAAVAKPVVPAPFSQHGLSAPQLRVLRSLPRPASHGDHVAAGPPAPRHSDGGAAADGAVVVSASEAAAATKQAVRARPWRELVRQRALPATQHWEQVVVGWLLAGLTPGLPCPWHPAAAPAVLAASRGASYAPVRVCLALMEAAAGLCGEQEEEGGSPPLAFHPLLPDALLAAAAGAAQLVAVPAQQRALQHGCQGSPRIAR